MRNEILAFAQQQAQAAARRAIVPVAFGAAALVFFALTLVALFGALFFWLAPLYGRPIAALITAAVALVLGLIASLPLVVRRRPPPPAPAPNSNLPQLVSLVAQSASGSPKQTALAAFLLAIGLGLMARGSASGKK
jgi:hypothetical protein